MPKTKNSKIAKQMIDLLSEDLIPVKGYRFSNEKATFDSVRIHTAQLKSLIDIYCENVGLDKTAKDIDEARQRLVRIVEVTEAKNIPGIHRTIYHRLQNGLMLIDEFSCKEYRKTFETVEMSMYFITTSAITFSYEILLFADAPTELHYRTPLDWTLALWNALCYHKESFAKRFIKDRWEFELFIDLTDCICEVLSFLLRELEKHGF